MTQWNRLRAAPSLRFGVIYAALFLQFGFLLPYWPVYLKARGLDPQAIGLFYAVMGLARVVTVPLAALLGEHYGQGARYLLFLALGAAVAYALMAWAHGTATYLLVAVAIATFVPALMAIVDAKTLAAAQAGELVYGRARLWGSATFIVVNLAGGALIAKLGPAYINWLLFEVALLGAASLLLLPHAAPRESNRPRVSMREVRALLGNWRLIAFIAAAGLGQASHAVFYTFGTLDWQHQGYGETLIGALWAIGVVAEIVLFAFGQRLSTRFSPLGLAMLAVGISIVRWLVMVLNPPLASLFAVQLLHAFSFGALHLATMSGLHRMVSPALSATAQGLYAAVSGGVLMAFAVAFPVRFMLHTDGMPICSQRRLHWPRSAFLPP